MVAPIALVSPRWASEVTRATPDRPQAVRAPKKPSHPGPVFGAGDVQAQDFPVAVRVHPGRQQACTLTVRPCSRTFRTSMSAAKNV
jgi:hypothetical protein